MLWSNFINESCGALIPDNCLSAHKAFGPRPWGWCGHLCSEEKYFVCEYGDSSPTTTTRTTTESISIKPTTIETTKSTINPTTIEVTPIETTKSTLNPTTTELTKPTTEFTTQSNGPTIVPRTDSTTMRINAQNFEFLGSGVRQYSTFFAIIKSIAKSCCD